MLTKPQSRLSRSSASCNPSGVQAPSAMMRNASHDRRRWPRRRPRLRGCRTRPARASRRRAAACSQTAAVADCPVVSDSVDVLDDGVHDDLLDDRVVRSGPIPGVMSCWEPRAQWKHLALDALGAEWCGKPPILVRKIAFDLHGRRLSRSAPRASWSGRSEAEDPAGVAVASTWITMGLHVGVAILSLPARHLRRCCAARLRKRSPDMSAALASGARSPRQRAEAIGIAAVSEQAPASGDMSGEPGPEGDRPTPLSACMTDPASCHLPDGLEMIEVIRVGDDAPL